MDFSMGMKLRTGTCINEGDMESENNPSLLLHGYGGKFVWNNCKNGTKFPQLRCSLQIENYRDKC